MRRRASSSVITPRKKHSEAAEKEDYGAALTEKSSKSQRPRRKPGWQALNVTKPKKKQSGPAKETEKYGAVSMGKSCSQPKPNVGSEAVKPIALKKKHANDVVVVATKENAGPVLTGE